MQEDAVIYTRVSSLRQVREGNGLGSQETRCRGYADVKNYNVCAVFSDDITGGTDERPGLKSLIAYLNKHPRTIVVIDDISRLARDFEVHVRIRGAIRDAQGRLESPSLTFGEDPDSKLIEYLLAVIAQHQREKNRDQVLNRMTARLEAGYWPFRKPRGYEYEMVEGHGNTIVPRDPVASIIKEVLLGYSTGRFQSQAEIQRFLEAQPAFPRSPNGEVKIDVVRELLENVLYAGYLEYPKWGISLRKAKHEGLVSFETFRAIQERLAGKPKSAVRADIDADFPLRGFIKCAKCGQSIGGGWTKGNGGDYPYYFCMNRKCAAGSKSLVRAEVEQRFERLLQHLTPSQDLVDLATDIFRQAWEAQAATAGEQRDQLIKERGDCRRQITQFADRAVATDVPEVVAAYEQRIRELRIREIAIGDRLASSGAVQPEFDQTYRTAIDFLASPWKLWRSERLEDRIAVLRLTFADKLQYCKNEGFRTAETTLPFKVLASIRNKESGLVEPIGIEPTTS